MMKKDKRNVEITREIAERLKQCPNCNGDIEQVNSYRITCKYCNYSYVVRTRLEKEIGVGFALLFLVFLSAAIGYLIGAGVS